MNNGPCTPCGESAAVAGDPDWWDPSGSVPFPGHRPAVGVHHANGANASTAAPRRRHRALALALLVTVAFGSWPYPYADIIVSVTPGPGATSDPDDLLGPPTGEGLWTTGIDTYTLGVGGSITVHLGEHCMDAAGTDLIVSENPFFLLGSNDSFVEVMFVEVSSNGSDFARFPTSYTGPPGPFPPFSGSPPYRYRGFAGVMPVAGNPNNGVDPMDVVDAGGDAFDFQDLTDDPLVQAGFVNLDDIEYVRLIDIDSGSTTDSSGNVIWDHGLDGFASADPDAVTAVNNHDNIAAGRPEVELDLDAAGFLTIRVKDDDGLADIGSGLKASVNGFEVDFFDLVPFFVVTDLTATAFTLTTGPIPPGTFGTVLKVGAVDLAGLTSGDALVIQ